MLVNTKLLIVIFLFLGLFDAIGQEWEQDYNKGWEVLSVKDSAFSYFNSARSIAIEQDSLEGMVYSGQSLMYTSGYHYDLVQFKKYLQLFKEDMKLVKDEELKAYARSIYLFESINYNYKSGDYNPSKKYIDSLVHFIETSSADVIKSTKDDLYSSSIKYQASIYKHQGQFEQARETYRQLLNYIENNTSEPNALLKKQFSIYRLLSQTHAAAGDIDKAIDVEKRLLNNQEVKENYLSTNSGVILVLTHITNLIDVGRFEEAREQLLLLPQTLKLNARFQITDLENRARLYYEEGRVQKALKQIEEALLVATDYTKDNTDKEVVNLKIRKAQFLNNHGKQEQAFEIYSHLLEQLNANENDLTFINKRLKIKVLNGLFSNENSKELNQVHISRLVYQLMDAIDFLQPQFENAIDRDFLIEDTFETIQKAFDINASHYLKSKNKKAIKIAYQLSEKYRVIQLRQNVDPQSIALSNLIDGNLKTEEKQLSSQILYLQNKVLSTPSLKDSLFQLNEKYNVLKATIKNQSPEFYALKFGNSINSMTQAQKSLDKDQAVLSYFFGRENLYYISLDNQNVELETIEWNTKNEQELDELIVSLGSASVKQKLDFTNLSQLILQPLAALEKKRYIIIPDGKLYALPFEILDYNGQYLLHSAAVSYEESITLSMENTGSAKLNNVKVKAYAPFTNSQITSDFISGYAPLNYAKDELVFPLQKMNTELFMGQNASLSRFRESLNSNQPQTQLIIHIASHAAVNYKNASESYILFKGKEPEKLLAQDVFNLNLENSFVILSACETGIGEVVNGQGMRSFSQAFRYAGARSLLHSKWKVSDRSTAVIMNAFYEEVASGNTKDVALQQAKLRYLQQAPDAQSRDPYYWAGFVLSGDMTPLPMGNNYLLWLFLGLIFIVALAILLFKNTKPDLLK